MLVRLRPAIQDDAALLLAWRNEPEVIACSQSQRAVTEEEHRAWLTRMLTPDMSGTRYPAAIWIAYVEGATVGMVRLDWCWPSLVCDISLIVDREWRHKTARIGWQMLDLIIGEASRVHCRGIEAVIQQSNLASRRLFTHFGFIRQSHERDEWPHYYLGLSHP